ncbi:MAG: hypothetical protein JWN72_1707 [Thermoleophilia bacterium]|nr:hypothetical protein [Thermoleophilia bacterium]
MELNIRPAAPQPAPAAVPARDFVHTPTMVEGRRPADVIAAKDAYSAWTPNFGTLSKTDAKRAQSLIHAAIKELPTPAIYVNRRLDKAEAQLKSDRPFLTMFDAGQALPDIDRRRSIEQKYGTYGVGDDAGHSVYGSVQFSDAIAGASLLSDPERADAAKTSRANMGLQYYGPISLILKPEAWARATVQPGDSYNLDGVATKPGAAENLADVTTERVVSHFESWDHDRLKSALELPRREAIDLFKQHLASSRFTHPVDMMEAAVRTVDNSDVAEIRMMRAPGTQPGSIADRALRRIRYHANKLGIEVHQRTAKGNEVYAAQYTPDQLAAPVKDAVAGAAAVTPEAPVAAAA